MSHMTCERVYFTAQSVNDVKTSILLRVEAMLDECDEHTGFSVIAVNIHRSDDSDEHEITVKADY